jgi:ABC-type Fe3+/spermidine/putrescine transport system ATPase subunit
VSFDVEAGEIICVLGPSGCGKTTLLRVIAGLEVPDAGGVVFDGRDLSGVPVHRRGFGLMFQELALFPHKNVWENVIFGLRMQGVPADAIARQARDAMALVGLAGFERRDVNELSGGEKQRVALARSLAPRPRLLMLDEPLGSLDRKLREELMSELRRILKQAGLTSIYVTHDQQEAFTIADRVVVMNGGRVEQIGTPQLLYRRPASEWVARFLGLTNLLEGEVRPDSTVKTAVGVLRSVESAFTSGRVTVLIRPDAARDGGGGPNEENTVVGRVIERSFRGGHSRVVVRAGETDLVFELGASMEQPEPGQPIRLTLNPESIVLLSG